jgi:hypothetical protein
MASKVGLDDFLVGGGDPDDLIINATPADELATVADALRSRIAQLAELSELEYETVRIDVAEEFGARVTVLDSHVNRKRLERPKHSNGAAAGHTGVEGATVRMRVRMRGVFELLKSLNSPPGRLSRPRTCWR